MVWLRTVWSNIRNDGNLKTGKSWKLGFWVGIVISVALVVTKPATCFEQLDENGNNEMNEFFLNTNKTAVEFHNLIERLESTNNTELFTAVDKNGGTVLHRAVQKFNVLNETLDILKAHHVDFNAVDDDGNSVFFNAVQFGRNESFLTTLISYGMEWDTKFKNNDTALHVAALYGNLQAVNLLLFMGSDVNAQNSDGQTPLHQAVLPNNAFNKPRDIMREFFRTGRHKNVSENCGKSSLLEAGSNHSLQPIFQLIRVLIENHADVNAVDNDGNTFLHCVALSCTPALLHKTVAYLDYTNNTNCFSINNKGRQSLLIFAAWKMDVQNETLAILQKRGVDFKATANLGFPILLTAVLGGRSESFLRNLIAFGADWRVSDDSQNTVLHVAAPWGNLNALKLFIQLGADVNALNEYGNTPLHSAFWSHTPVSRFDIITELVNHGANGNIRTEGGDFPIDLAQQKLEESGKLEGGIIEVLESMHTRPSFNQSECLNGSFNRTAKLANILGELEQLKSKDDEIRRILFKVVRTEELDTINSVLEHIGKSLNIDEIWEEKLHSLLHVAIKYRDYSITAHLVNCGGFAEKLRDANFNGDLVELCLRNVNRVSPASFEHNLAILQLLFDSQPELIESPIIMLNDGWFTLRRRATPLLYSSEIMFSNGKQLELIQMLIKNKANVNAKILDTNKTALHLMADFNPYASQLTQVIRVLIENHADANAVDEDGNTFLHILAEKSNATVLVDVVQLLNLRNSTNLHLILNKQRNTPLHIAAFKGNLDAVKLFIQLGIDINAPNKDGSTPLHLALGFNRAGATRLEIVTELINHGANGNIQDESGDFPIDLAQRHLEQRKLEDGIMQRLQNMENRPSLNKIENFDGQLNSSVKLTNILNELEQHISNSTKTARLFQIVRTQDLNTINSILGHVGKYSDVTEISNEEFHSFLHVAIKYRDYSIVEYLINNQGFAKKLNDTRINVDLIQFCLGNIGRVSSVSFEHKLKILQLLFDIQPDFIESNFKLNIWGDATTPLLHSVAFEYSNGKQLELIQMLIENKANVNARTLDTNRTALHLAADNNGLVPQLVQIIRILIENHADPNAVDGMGETFLHILARKCTPVEFHEVVSYLDSINKTYSLTIKNCYNQTENSPSYSSFKNASSE